MADVFIYDALRTPRGRGKAGKGGLANHHPQELLAQTLNHMAERSKLDKNLVDDLAVGCVTQVKEQGACIARVALIAAQWPEEVTGFTINRFCGSGLEAVNSIAAKIGAGFSDSGIGGGVESMSRVPMGSDEAMLDGLNEKLRKRLYLVPQGISADLIATREGFTREDVDKFALDSQQKAARAIENKHFANAMFAVKNDDGSLALDRDEHPRADTTLERLAGLRPVMRVDGATVTAGNSSGQNDGAAACLVTTREKADALGLAPQARLVSWAVAGVPPHLMGLGPVPATAEALRRAGLSLDDMDLIELNEAFAAQVLGVLREWKLPSLDQLNVNGSGISLGHPVGATGTRILATLLYELRRREARYGLETMCIGGGQGLAAVFERVA
jgi:acetyl-CoA C-acetyltransferase